MPNPRHRALVLPTRDIGAPSAENAEFVVIQTHLFRGVSLERMTIKDYIARAHLIKDLKQDLGVNDEGIGVILYFGRPGARSAGGRWAICFIRFEIKRTLDHIGSSTP